jgi:hypothetical protein
MAFVLLRYGWLWHLLLSLLSSSTRAEKYGETGAGEEIARVIIREGG